MKKQIPPLIAAFIITCIIAGFMVAVSANAYFNQNGVTASNSPTGAANVSQVTNNQQAQIDQLQGRIQEYQQREQQYQTLLQQDQQQIQQDQQTFQQVQQLLMILQQRGLIQIQNDGRIVISGGG